MRPPPTTRGAASVRCVSCRSVRRSTNARNHSGVVVCDKPAVDVQHLVVPGRDDPAVLDLARVPARRDVGVGSRQDRQRLRLPAGLPPVLVGRATWPSKACRSASYSSGSGVDTSPSGRRSDEVREAAGCELFAHGLVVGTEVSGDVHLRPPAARRARVRHDVRERGVSELVGVEVVGGELATPRRVRGSRNSATTNPSCGARRRRMSLASERARPGWAASSPPHPAAAGAGSARSAAAAGAGCSAA